MKKLQFFKMVLLVIPLFLLSLSCSMFTDDVVSSNLESLSRLNGLNATYFSGTNLQTKIMEETVPEVNLFFGAAGPNEKVPHDDFSIRFIGSIKPEYSETYTFKILTKDNVRLWINNQQVINNWSWQSTGEAIVLEGSIPLKAGKLHNLVLEFYDDWIEAAVHLYWQSPSQPFEIVPNAHLFLLYDIETMDLCPDDGTKRFPGACGCGEVDIDGDHDGAPDCIDSCPADHNKKHPQHCGCGVADTNSDDDPMPDCMDHCPKDSNKWVPGICGCGKVDVDENNDNVCDSEDQCPNDPDKINPGICGCGTPDTDSDSDGLADCKDQCASDPKKTSPEQCGCGKLETDSDSDGIANCNDNCPVDPKKVNPGICGCGKVDVDKNNDGQCDEGDNCPGDPNKTNPGICGCGTPDTDSDNDGTPDCNDQCSTDPNKTYPGVCGCGKPETPTCGASSPDNTVFTTAGASDLDTSDRIDFRNGVVQGGYTNLGDIYNVSASQFANVLKRSDIKVLFMASHGAPGAVWCTDSGLNCTTMPVYGVENVIYSTCSTLGDTCLKSKMGPTTQTILGYTDSTWDGIANQMAKKMSSNIVSGQSYIRAWYATNVAISQLSDRWCAYVREGSSIVEYSARSGNTPRSIDDCVFESRGSDEVILVNSDLLYDARVFENYYVSLKDKNYFFTGNAEQEVTFLTGQQWEFLLNKRSGISDEEVMGIANEFLKDSLPLDAELESINMINKDDFQVAHSVRFIREKNDMKIAGNYEEHHIELVINDGKVVAYSRYWPEMSETPGSSYEYESLLTVYESVEFLSYYLSEKARNPMKIVSVRPCYGSDSNTGNLVPAHCYVDDTEATWVVSAVSGEFLE